MVEFPCYNALKCCLKVVEKKTLLIDRENKLFGKVQGLLQVKDSNEQIFRKMICRIAGLEKEIKDFSSPNMKQMMIVNKPVVKRKHSVKNRSKEIKFN